MAKTTIEWTNYTWNPWVGCKKVSAGCKNCYMYREQTQRGNDPAFIRRTKTLNDPLKWANGMVFTCSYSDFFIQEADEWRADAWDIIRRTPNLTYQILTKRIERVKDCLPDDWPLQNVWLGVSAEDQGAADRRIPLLLQARAAVRFVSVEPMLGAVSLWGWLSNPSNAVWYQMKLPMLDWVICGCESGPGARPVAIDDIRSLRDQCVAAGVPFFLKQMMVDGKLIKMPELDGKVWDQMPE